MPAWAAYALAGAMVAACVVAIIIARARVVARDARWLFFPRACGLLPAGMRYLPPGGGFDPCRLADALRLAINCIGAQRWGAQQIVTKLVGARIQVMPVSSWENVAGVRVAGEAQLAALMIAVDVDLKSLAHELCHLLEWSVDGTEDDAHAGWRDKGLLTAIDQYETALKGSS